MGYFDYEKDKEYLICIDSDGCAMDTMDVKHIRCFGPEWIKTFGLEKYQEEGLEYWNKINLYSKTRGINRFKGLAMALEEMERRGLVFDGLDTFIRWTKEAKELSNPALLEACQKTNSLYGIGFALEYPCKSIYFTIARQIKPFLCKISS